MYSLNGHPFAHTSLSDYRAGYGSALQSPDLDDPSPDDKEEYTGGISFLNREFLKFGVLFVVGVSSEVALYRCVPGEAFFQDQDVHPWSLEEQGRLDRSDDHSGGECTMVKFIGYVLCLSSASRTSVEEGEEPVVNRAIANVQGNPLCCVQARRGRDQAFAIPVDTS